LVGLSTWREIVEVCAVLWRFHGFIREFLSKLSASWRFYGGFLTIMSKIWFFYGGNLSNCPDSVRIMAVFCPDGEKQCKRVSGYLVKLAYVIQNSAEFYLTCALRSIGDLRSSLDRLALRGKQQGKQQHMTQREKAT
jgi:hypothetical protein